MLDAESWSEPEVVWSAPADLAAIIERLSGYGELLAVWPPAPTESTSTHCTKIGDECWIVQPGVGLARFRTDAPRLSATPANDGNPDWFREVVTRSWLPAIYPFWGRQVLHASAVALANDNVVAFTGPTHSGKSTTAYALGRRPGWRLVADDSLAFAWSPIERAIRIHRLQNEARLRPASAEYFGHEAWRREDVAWPAGRLTLRTLFVLEAGDAADPPATFTRLTASESLPLLLQQAFALSFAIPEYNRQLLTNYAQLAAVPAFRLRYRPSFDAAATLYDAIEAHVASVMPAVAATQAFQGLG